MFPSSVWATDARANWVSFMKNSLTEKTWVPISVAVIAALALAKVAWVASERSKQMDQNTASIALMRAEFGGKLDALLEMKTDIAVIKRDVAALQTPVKYTRRDVKALRKEIAQINVGPVAAFQTGPLTMSGHN
jgi:septal ring factor EnvC (AmiA/AmiB activator)